MDETRSCRLVFDGRVSVDIGAPAAQTGTVFLHSAVGVLPASGREAIYEQLLSSNLFGRDTGAAVLAVDRDLGEVVLLRRLDERHLGYAEFTDALEDFIARVGAWTEKLKSGASAGGGRSQEAFADHSMMRV
ncbi:hypothetical protein GGQ76_000550 [Aureimonas jatrophae]|uniref:Tir chaperone protein (CesT) family protein n=1 Tax=Aureimonas jatrophae TaxID=1166073 RepID=A0A1H0CL21_9HYPH|nr:type III secretion system chaperone [Aureimonas jatrophae]MBB3949282.1 hypothetical protein [Aureimonas jatrophae]SDN58588.1 Tir chaperone protein (CesT) family protein [Aureimonas jatrophae]